MLSLRQNLEQLYNIEVKDYQDVLPSDSEKCHYVNHIEKSIESTGNYWQNLHAILIPKGFQVILC